MLSFKYLWRNNKQENCFCLPRELFFSSSSSSSSPSSYRNHLHRSIANPSFMLWINEKKTNYKPNQVWFTHTQTITILSLCIEFIINPIDCEFNWIDPFHHHHHHLAVKTFNNKKKKWKEKIFFDQSIEIKKKKRRKKTNLSLSPVDDDCWSCN